MATAAKTLERKSWGAAECGRSRQGSDRSRAGRSEMRAMTSRVRRARALLAAGFYDQPEILELAVRRMLGRAR